MRTKAGKPAPKVDTSADIFEKRPEETVVETTADVDFVDQDETRPIGKEKRLTTMKIIVWFCLLNGIAWVWCSYILAWRGKEQIAESLSQVALKEIIGVVLVYAIKSIFENLSKNNSWPDKSRSDPSDGIG